MHALFEQDDASVRGYLGHMISTTQTAPLAPGRYENTYTTYPVSFNRPESGQIFESRTCPVCKAELKFLIRSVPAVSGLRTRLRAIGAALLAYALVDLAFLFPGSVETLRKVWGSTLALSVIAAVVLLLFSTVVSEFDLAVVLKDGAEPQHKIFETLEPSGG